MIVESVIERLKVVPGVRILAGAADLAQIKDGRPPATPAIYVIPAEEASSENERGFGGVLQRTEMDFTVVIVTSNLSDRREAAASGDIEPFKRAVRRALVGWMPDDADDVVTHVAGRLTKASGGTVWWEEDFATAYYQEATEEP